MHVHTINMVYMCNAVAYRDMTSALFCRFINAVILLLFLTILIRYKAKMKHNQHIVKAIRHVFGFGIEFFENKDIGTFGHFIVIDFIKWYSYHTYFSPISTS